MPPIDPCRLARQVKEFPGLLAAELLHLPGEPAGVGEPTECSDPASRRTASPAGQAGRGPDSLWAALHSRKIACQGDDDASRNDHGGRRRYAVLAAQPATAAEAVPHPVR